MAVSSRQCVPPGCLVHPGIHHAARVLIACKWHIQLLAYIHETATGSSLLEGSKVLGFLFEALNPQPLPQTQRRDRFRDTPLLSY